MSRHVAFLRAVNVAGHGRAKMSDVRDIFDEAGGKNVSTYIQSGNVIFDSRACDGPIVVAKATRGLRALLGEEPVIMLRTMRRLTDLVDSAPFTGFRMPEPAKRYVVFLLQKPKRLPEFPLISTVEALHAVAIDGREVFLISGQKKNGFFGFPNNFIEAKLAVSATSRNWSTITKLVGKFGTIRD